MTIRVLAGTLGLAAIMSGCCSAGPGRLEPIPAAELEARVRELREEHRFTILAVHPFVVVGGGRPEEVRGFAEDVIAWAVERLHRELFDLWPSEIVEIWAMRSQSSYLAWAGEAIGGAPDTPYGVYRPCAGAILVNRGLGDGTLVHEMVHVFVEVDFPGAPTWLNEGLGSLYEQPAERKGHIVGLVNWRLPGLQRALRRGTAPRLREVMESSRIGFYGDDRGLMYAVARYLMFYLQEKGLLREYYRAFRDGDENGIDILERVIGAPLEAFEPRWRRFVRSLHYRRDVKAQ